MALFRCGAGSSVIPANNFIMTGFTPGSGYTSESGSYTDDTAFAVNKTTYSSSSACFINTKGKTSLTPVTAAASWGGVGIKADGSQTAISTISSAVDITDFDYVIISVAAGSTMGTAYTIKIS